MARNWSRAAVARHENPQSARLGDGHGHLAEAARCAGDEQGLSRLGLEFFRDGLIGGQSGQRDSGGGGKVIPRGHAGERRLRDRDIFRERADFLLRQAGVNPVARLECGHMAADLFHDAGAFVAQRQRHGVVLDQPDAAREDQQLERVDRGCFDFYQHFVCRDLRQGKVAKTGADLFGIFVDLYCFHVPVLSFSSECSGRFRAGRLHFIGKPDTICCKR